jgi:transcription initiation factor IIE alpha subunit
LDERGSQIEVRIVLIAAELIETLVRKSGILSREVAEITGINREKVRKMLVSKEPSL